MNRLLILEVDSSFTPFTIAVHAAGEIPSALEDCWHKFGWTVSVVTVSDWAFNKHTGEWQLAERYTWR